MGSGEEVGDWEVCGGGGPACFHMRGLPPHQAVFKEEQQVAAARGNLRLSGCQCGITAICLTLLTSALFPSEEEETEG